MARLAVSKSSSSGAAVASRTSSSRKGIVKYMTSILIGFLFLMPMAMIWRSSLKTQSINNELIALSSGIGSSFFAVGAGSGNAWNHLNPLEIPPGKAQNLPSIRVEQSNIASNVDQERDFYGGKGDKKHLGGFTEIDYQGISPRVWKNMVEVYGVRSVLDVGCGRGISTSWFALHGVDVLCVEGSHDAVERSLLAPSQVVEHDFSRGPWWPEDTYDAAWAVEFLEHVGINYQFNYVSAFRKAALLFVSSSRWQGWHHVEVHKDPWWIQKYTSYGFRFSQSLTNQVRNWAKNEQFSNIPTPTQGHRKQNTTLNAQHIWLTMKVFVNPLVASLPKHAHLFFEHGCYGGNSNGQRIHRPCGTGGSSEAAVESTLPESFLPLQLTPEMDEEWASLLRGNVNAEGKKVIKLPGKKPSLVPSDITESEIMRRLKTRKFSDLPIVPVVAWPYITYGVKSAEHLHVEENGISESRFLRLVKNFSAPDENEVWVGDTGWGFGWNKWCVEFLKVIKEARTNRTAVGLPTKWPVIIVDFTDSAGFQRCREIESFMGRENVRYTTRSLGQGRRWDKKSLWVKYGHRINTTLPDGTFYAHTPLVVRTDTIENMDAVLRKESGMNLWDDIEAMERAVDITHLWPLDLKGVNAIFSELRLRVSQIVHKFGNETGYNAFVGLKGEAIRSGRRGVKTAYIKALLETKILVVTQRDSWEDHYRLMEALVSGACVFTDFMHGLPAGLQDGASIVIFTSEESLRSLLKYYLENPTERIAIARRGREIALTRHRTWHRMEEIVFGEILSTCSAVNHSHCPYIVHAEGR